MTASSTTTEDLVVASAPMVTPALGGRAWRAGPRQQRRLTWWQRCASLLWWVRGGGGVSIKCDSKGGLWGEGDYSYTLTFVSIRVLLLRLDMDEYPA
jgi:hypothetical protein